MSAGKSPAVGLGRTESEEESVEVELGTDESVEVELGTDESEESVEVGPGTDESEVESIEVELGTAESEEESTEVELTGREANRSSNFFFALGGLRCPGVLRSADELVRPKPEPNSSLKRPEVRLSSSKIGAEYTGKENEKSKKTKMGMNVRIVDPLGF
jgi:hypothetical protein